MNDAELRELIERSHLLHELTFHPGWSILVDYMETVVMKGKKDKLLHGDYETVEQYKENAGFCKGASRVLKAYEVLGAQVERERERREENRLEEVPVA